MNYKVEQLPEYLYQYCSQQDYSQYTSRDHAVWRYIMRQNRAFFKKHAMNIYIRGLEQTGIPIHRIPKIEEMDQKLKEFGWGAVPVSGFIPPAAFLSFQANRVLPIATQMRRIDNIAYTPAPDIVHEAAGHAPIIADKRYRDYLQEYADVAKKAIISKQDLDIYEAIRALSDIKEDPTATNELISQAQSKLDAAVAAVTHTSEATKTSRMAWWTTEYGLVTENGGLKIYGAGLLSSVGESQNYLSPTVDKQPLTAECVDIGYDITKPQPQLFVAESIEHLSTVLKEFAQTLSYQRGGVYGLEQAKLSKIVNTVEFENGLQLSARVIDFIKANQGQIKCILVDLKKAQICFKDKEIAKFNLESGVLPVPILSLEDVKFLRSQLNNSAVSTITLSSGVKITCKVQSVEIFDGREVYFVLCDPCFEINNDQIKVSGLVPLFVVDNITSVFGGAADRQSFGNYDMGQASTLPGVLEPSNESELKLFDQYKQIREFREMLLTKNKSSDYVSQFINESANYLLSNYPKEWLAFLELIELNCSRTTKSLKGQTWYQDVKLNFENYFKNTDKEWLIAQGMGLLYTLD